VQGHLAHCDGDSSLQRVIGPRAESSRTRVSDVLLYSLLRTDATEARIRQRRVIMGSPPRGEA
jgi:hypothetical protein